MKTPAPTRPVFSTWCRVSSSGVRVMVLVMPMPLRSGPARGPG
nr:hypothetical protein [Kibdelosporangium sp. MJ126-NF4]CTQ92160.1 hypothetical protein [Kibdelosporangium sp. MJ126-NF4]